MATRVICTPESTHFPSSNFAALAASNRRPVLAFDASTAETAYWTFVAPQGISGTWTAVISYAMASATSGDAVDTDSATSFDTANTGTDSAVPGTAGYMEQVSVTLTNADSIAAGDLVRVSVTRAVANAADTATGDCYVFAVELRDAA